MNRETYQDRLDSHIFAQTKPIIVSPFNGLRQMAEAMDNPKLPRTEDLELQIVRSLDEARRARERRMKTGLDRFLEHTPEHTAVFSRSSMFSRFWREVTKTTEAVASKFKREDKEESYTEIRRKEQRIDNALSAVGGVTVLGVLAIIAGNCVGSLKNPLLDYGPYGAFNSPEEARAAFSAKTRNGVREYSVSLPEVGLTIPRFRILTGNERDIFNVDEPETQAATPDKPGQVIIIVPNTIQKALEKPSPQDDEITKLVRSYLTPEILSELNTLPIKFVMFPSKGPEGEKIKPEFASLWGWYNADFVISYRDAYSFFPNNHRFNMKDVNDLRDFERLSNINEFKEGWRLLIAKQLLEYGANGQNSGIKGFLVNRDLTEITDVILEAKSSKTYPVINIEALIRKMRGIL